MYRILFPASLILLAACLSAQAKDLKILTGAGMSMPVRQLAGEYAARTGSKVDVVSDTAGGVQKRMESGEAFDLVIATTTVVENLTRAGKVGSAHSNLARMVAGIGARKGTAQPAIGDAAAVKTTLLAAKNISYVDPASGGITGVFFLSQADKLGIGNEVRAKAVLAKNGTGVAAAVADGSAQYGVTLISEMLPNPNVTVWPLPEQLQMTTIYTAAIATDARNAMDAAAMLNDLRGPKGRDANLKAGLQPVSP
ncbi:MAG: substrate-binding domain-containing protein [Pseudomonadota bacterium]